MEVYLPDAHQLEGGGSDVDEIDVLALPRRPLGGIENPKVPAADQAQPPPPGFKLVETRRTDDFLLVRYRTRAPRPVTPDLLVSESADPDVAPLVLTEPDRQ